MDFGLSAEQEMIVQTFRAFAETRDPVWKGK
jgi:hypothetical protein